MRKGIKKMVTILLSTALLSTFAVGCGNKSEGTPSSAKGPKGKVMIYTSIYPDIIETVKPALNKQFPDLQIEWFQGGTEKVMTKMAGEIEAKKIQADLLMVADPSYYLYLKEKGLLLKYDAPNRKDVKLNKDEEGYWTGVRVSNMIIAYNTDKVKPEEAPKSFKDLLNPKWNGKIGMPNPLLSGTAYVAAAVLSDKYGWDYFEKLKKNGLKVDEGNSAVQNKIVTGEYLAGMILEENILKLAAKGEPLKVVYPEDGTIVIPSPIAILKDGPNTEAAKAIEDWWLSKEGQEAIVKGWMHSVRGDVNPPKGAPELKTFYDKAMKIDWDKLNKENEKVKEKFRSTVLE